MLVGGWSIVTIFIIVIFVFITQSHVIKIEENQERIITIRKKFAYLIQKKKKIGWDILVPIDLM